jgi:acetyl-CoA/propionyl-CoA carboxylase biotin carboxyl carrier protein
VRVDAGVESGSVVGGQFDSLLAKLIVTGSDRAQALERSRRALAEFQVEGMATVLPFHRLVVEDPAYAAGTVEDFTVHTRWIETEWDNTVEPFTGTGEAAAEQAERQTVVVEVGGRRLEVSLPGDLALGSAGGGGGAAAVKKPRKRGGGKSGGTVSGDAVTAPMQGTVIKVAVSDGDTVEAGQLVVVLEAMKMENPVTAHKAGTITGLTAEQGASVSQGTVFCEIKD